MSTGIQWTDETWNPTTGCSLVSEGCRNCYAMRQARRFDGHGRGYDGTTELTPKGPRWTGKVNLHPDRLEIPLRWRKPRRVFVDSMSDLFHEDVPFEFVAAVFGVMWYAHEHTFQVLTKRPERAVEFFRWLGVAVGRNGVTGEPLFEGLTCDPLTGVQMAAGRYVQFPPHCVGDRPWTWPLPNVWLGTSVENQETAEERIPHLRRCPATVLFISGEPLLGPLDVGQFVPRPMYHCSECGQEKMRDWCKPCGTYDNPVTNATRGIDWVIVGGESGHDARRFDIAWARDLIRQCREAGVPCFVKQLGAKPWDSSGETQAGVYSPGGTRYAERVVRGEVLHLCDRKGGDPDEWPEDLRVREFPETPDPEERYA